jgi:hypothetical protein
VSVHVCVCVREYICIERLRPDTYAVHVRMHMRMHLFVDVHTYIEIYIRIYICTCKFRVHTHTYTCFRVCCMNLAWFLCVYVKMCVCENVHILPHAHALDHAK